MCSQESRRLTCVYEDDEDDSLQPTGEFQSFMMRVRRRIRKVPVFLLAMVLLSFFHAGHSVWSFNIPHQAYFLAVTPLCRNLGGLSEKQIQLCLKYKNKFRSNHMADVGNGAKMAIAECKHQFQYSRWNCSKPDIDKDTLFSRIRSQSTRESAFTYAISSAGVMWAIARACAEQNLSDCSCSLEARPEASKDLRKEYIWGGCGDNLKKGEEFSKKFMDAGEVNDLIPKKHARTLMNLHNNKIGRMVVKETAKIDCKCHGVSGSCNIKTCWRMLGLFREIGNILHDKYDAAVHVELKRLDGLSTLLPKRKRRSYKRQLPSTKSALLYLENSPDFCFRNTRQGIPGTHGRRCHKDATGTESCKLLCCDRGYNTKIQTVTKRCRCKFYWCCYVKCKVCRSNETVHTCK